MARARALRPPPPRRPSQDILSRRIVETRPWQTGTPAPPVFMLADARSTPARIAAVLYADGDLLFCDYAPPAELMQRFRARKDGQIAGLELLAVALGLCTWPDRLRKRNVVIFSDNTIAEFNLQKGTAKELDHCAVIHAFWVGILELGASVWVERVPTGAARPRPPARHATWAAPCAR